MRERDRNEFNLLFWELEGITSINEFWFLLFIKLIKLYRSKQMIYWLTTLLADLWNEISERFQGIKTPADFEFSLRAKTRTYDFDEWKKKIEPLILGLNKENDYCVLVFDEFPDMLFNLMNLGRSVDFKKEIDNLPAWLRSIRETLLERYQINVESTGIQFILEKIANGPPYYGQLVIKALREHSPD